jgi:hypothetical protein
MAEPFRAIWEMLTSREAAGGLLGGPIAWRLIFQPSMATFLAVRAGLRDARAGRPAFFWAILTDADHRRELVRDGWKDVARVFVLAAIVEVVYEIVVEHAFRPDEDLLVAFLLALLPYLLFRGPVNRIARRFHRGAENSPGTTAPAKR